MQHQKNLLIQMLTVKVKIIQALNHGLVTAGVMMAHGAFSLTVQSLTLTKVIAKQDLTMITTKIRLDQVGMQKEQS